MRRRGVPALAVVFVAGLVLALAACGGGGKKSATPTTSTEVTTTESVTTTETTTSTATSTAAVAPATTPTTPSTTNFNKGPCRELSQKAEAAIRSAAAQGDVGAEADALRKIADQAPSEIKGDVNTLADALSSFSEALKSAGVKAGSVPSAAQLTKLQQAEKDFQAKVQAAEAHITAWAKKNCT